MDDVNVYWRNKVESILQWGAAVSVLLAGWAIKNHADFNLSSRATPADEDKFLAAVGLLAVVIPYCVLHPVAIGMIYKYGLKGSLDRTVLPGTLAVLFSAAVSLVTVLIAVLMAVR